MNSSWCASSKRHLLMRLKQMLRFSAVPNMNEHSAYEEAISALNSLQSNAFSQQNIKERIRRREACVNIKETWKFLARTGVQPEDLKKLSIIHVAGTKGKGSTSALCESILRHHGYDTGFYSSPHLVSVVERIRLNGTPMAKNHFASCFNRVYKDLRDKQEFEGDLPGYFGFLTVLAFNVFLEEKVDVAVIEVGIGGEYDITNVVNNVPVVGITSLGLEHTAILGDTIEQIAREKAGIMKQGCHAFTVSQPPVAAAVLQAMAAERKCTLSLVPDYDSYTWETRRHVLPAESPAFKMNASLAIQLAHKWMQLRKEAKHKSHQNIPDLQSHDNSPFKISADDNLNTEENNCFEDIKTNVSNLSKYQQRDGEFVNIPEKTLDGLTSCFWPGRCQILKDETADFYMDGAHTQESMQVCVHWFKNHMRKLGKKVLIFNTTGDRNSENLLQLMTEFNFEVVLFVPNVAFDKNNALNCKILKDQIDVTLTGNKVLQKCFENEEIWKNLMSIQNTNEKLFFCDVKVLHSVFGALEYIEGLRENDIERPQVLITGSLHLVGAALAVLDPDLSKSHTST